LKFIGISHTILGVKMKAKIIAEKKRVEFTGLDNARGFSISTEWHGVCCKPYNIECFKNHIFLNDYVMRFGTARQRELMRNNVIEYIG